MKGISFYCAIILILSLLNGCSKDDNNKSNDLLIGTWIAVDGTHNGENWSAADHNIIKFTANNRAEFIYEGFGNNGQDISEFGDWEITGNSLTIIWDESDPDLEVLELQVIELSQTGLIWEDVKYDSIEIFKKK